MGSKSMGEGPTWSTSSFGASSFFFFFVMGILRPAEIMGGCAWPLRASEHPLDLTEDQLQSGLEYWRAPKPTDLIIQKFPYPCGGGGVLQLSPHG